MTLAYFVETPPWVYAAILLVAAAVVGVILMKALKKPS